MRAKDIMTKSVITVAPDVDVREVAKLLLECHISGVPVVDAGGRVLGVVSEGDLMRRPESGTEDHRSWWLGFMASNVERAQDYVKTHGRCAQDVMTRDVISVTEETPVNEIAAMLEKRRIKRVPVLRDGRLVGLVSRANLLHGLASRRLSDPAPRSVGDRSIRDAVMAELQHLGWGTGGALNVIVADGIVQLWGWVDSEEERRAVQLAAENVAGVRSVEDHLGSLPPYLRGA